MADKDFGDTMMDAMICGVMFAAVAIGLSLTFIQRMLASTPAALAHQALQGHIDSRVLQATPVLQWINLISDPPYTAWVTASFYNDGLLVGGLVVENSVFIGVNNPDDLHELKYGETYDVDMMGGRGIEFIYYVSPNRCTVRAVGKY